MAAPAPEDDLNQIFLLRPFELPLSPPPEPRADTKRAGQGRGSPNPSRAPRTRLAALFRPQRFAHLASRRLPAGSRCCGTASLPLASPRGLRAGSSSSHECPKSPAPQDKPPAPPPRATCAVGRPCPPGTPASRPELRGSGGSSPARGARLQRERAEKGAERSGAQPAGPAAAGGNTRTGSTRGVGGGRGGSRPPRARLATRCCSASRVGDVK